MNKQQDLVTRVVGPPGIVLIGEGNPNRLRPMLAAERRKHERVASETPIHELLVGNGEGQVPLPKLTKRVTKLGKELKPAQMTDVLARIKALDANRSSIPMPKGPIPTSMKGMRGSHARALGPRPAQRLYAADPVHRSCSPRPLSGLKISGGITTQISSVLTRPAAG